MTDTLPLFDARFWARVAISDPRDCWEWLGTPGAGGYGRVTRDKHETTAHRYAYSQLIGPIPPGLVLDHLCRNRACVNPDHLEPVTAGENVARGESPSARAYRTGICPRGHVLRGADVYVVRRADGTVKQRMCKECQRMRDRRRQRVRRVPSRSAA